jgi:glucose-1-phosphate adenylyltransferase
VAALPVAGRFRIIDFILSSMVHSGIRNVGVIMQKNYHSLMDHLGSGKDWDLHGKNDGLLILPPFLSRENVGIYGGMLEALRSNTSYLRRSKQEYVVLSNSHLFFNADFDDMIAAHIKTGADITMLYAKRADAKPAEARSSAPAPTDCVYIDVDSSQRVSGIEYNPARPVCPHELLEVYLMKRELLRYLVEQADAHGMNHFRRDIIQRLVNGGTMKIYGHLFTGHYWRIDTVQAYFQMNMALLDPEIRRAVFVPDHPVYTKIRDDMPTHYGPNAQVTGSLVADGGQIEGTVENSVLFRGVKVEQGAVIRNSIVMQDAQIGAGSSLNYCILDKQAVIRNGGQLIGHPTYPIVIAKNIMI